MAASELEGILSIFRSWDATGDGMVGKDELIDIFCELGMARREASALFCEVDMNSDGRITIDEFVPWILGSSSGSRRVRQRANTSHSASSSRAVEHMERVGIAKQVDNFPEVVLKNKPNNSGKIIAKVPNGSAVTIVSEHGDYVKVSWDGILAFGKCVNFIEEEAAMRIGIAKQVDNFPDVVLKNQPKSGGEFVARVPNGSTVTILSEHGDYVKVYWEGKSAFGKRVNFIEGAAIRNLQDAGHLPDAAPPHETLQEALRGLIRSGAVRFVRFAWLCDLADAHGCVRRRQDLPEEAFVDMEYALANLDCTYVISYPWLSKKHPDPHGNHLQHFCSGGPVFDFRKLNPEVSMGLSHIGRPYSRPVDEVMVFWDFLSLFQVPRSPAEDALFRSALDSMHCLYASSPATDGAVLRILDVPTSAENNVPYVRRGWTMFETMVSVAGGRQVLTLKDGEISKARSMVPSLPDQFAAMVSELHFTSQKADRDKVVALYSYVFHKHLCQMTNMSVSHWTDDDVEQFVRVLPHFPKFAKLSIQWDDSSYTRDAAAALKEASKDGWQDYYQAAYEF